MQGRVRAGIHIAIGTREVYLGSIVGALGWTFVIVTVLVATIVFLCRSKTTFAWDLIGDGDNRLSLWRVQLAAWTIAIGSVVFCFGLTRLELPKIPDSLVALMGLSLATGGLGYIGNQRITAAKVAATGAPPPTAPQNRPFLDRLNDLLCDSYGEISISRAQMLFWTVLILILFMIKSIQESGLWDMPWEMVALMGISQAGDVGPKLTPPTSGNAPPNVAGAPSVVANAPPSDKQC
jgi:hypothetical protein